MQTKTDNSKPTEQDLQAADAAYEAAWQAAEADGWTYDLAQAAAAAWTAYNRMMQAAKEGVQG